MGPSVPTASIEQSIPTLLFPCFQRPAPVFIRLLKLISGMILPSIPLQGIRNSMRSHFSNLGGSWWLAGRISRRPLWFSEAVLNFSIAIISELATLPKRVDKEHTRAFSDISSERGRLFHIFLRHDHDQSPILHPEAQIFFPAPNYPPDYYLHLAIQSRDAEEWPLLVLGWLFSEGESGQFLPPFISMGRFLGQARIGRRLFFSSIRCKHLRYPIFVA